MAEIIFCDEKGCTSAARWTYHLQDGAHAVCIGHQTEVTNRLAALGLVGPLVPNAVRFDDIWTVAPPPADWNTEGPKWVEKAKEHRRDARVHRIAREAAEAKIGELEEQLAVATEHNKRLQGILERASRRSADLPSPVTTPPPAEQ
jgi:hypothetical protein